MSEFAEKAQSLPWYPHYRSPEKVHLDYAEETIPQQFDRQAEEHPDRILTEFFGARLTYSQVQEKSLRLASALSDLGVTRGDRVAVALPNSPQYAIAYLAVLRLGAVIAQVNPLYTIRELHHILKDSGAETVIALDRVVPRIDQAREGTAVKRIVYTRVKEFLPFPLSWLQPIKARREGEWVDLPSRDDLHNLSDLIRAHPPDVPGVTVDPKEDLAVLQYTGGTTGLAKGVMLTHYNLIANVYQMQPNTGEAFIEEHQRILAVLPFFHVYGLTVCLNLALLRGQTLIILPRFDPGEVLKTIDKARPSMFPGVPTMYVAVNNHPDVGKFDISSIQMMNSGAGPLPVEVLREFERKTGGTIVEGYGLSEAAPVVTVNPNGRTKPGSIGIPVADTLVRIVDVETGEEQMPPGEVGELLVQGPQVMKGYWQRPDETAGTVRNGWLYTGDVARMDEEGYFYIVERKKDLIITGGFNVYPREVEEVLYEHPGIQEAAVVGVPDSYAGERVKAFVVPRAGASLTEEEVIQWCRERLTAYKAPRSVEFRDDLPKTLVGKILRRQLRDEVQSSSEETAAASE